MTRLCRGRPEGFDNNKRKKDQNSTADVKKKNLHPNTADELDSNGPCPPRALSLSWDVSPHIHGGPAWGRKSTQQPLPHAGGSSNFRARLGSTLHQAYMCPSS